MRGWRHADRPNDQTQQTHAQRTYLQQARYYWQRAQYIQQP